jgi:hypothetical protein
VASFGEGLKLQVTEPDVSERLREKDISGRRAGTSSIIAPSQQVSSISAAETPNKLYVEYFIYCVFFQSFFIH